MVYKRTISYLLALFLLSQQVLADVVALKTGQMYSGTIANREEIRADPRASVTIAILIQGSTELRRFRAEDLQYLVLEDGGQKHVIDLSSLPTDKPVVVPSPDPMRQHYLVRGVTLTAVGLAAAAVGASAKFDPAKCTVNGSSIVCHGKRYNQYNYALIGVGGLLSVCGILDLVSFSNLADAQSTKDLHRPVVCLETNRGSSRILVGYRFGF